MERLSYSQWYDIIDDRREAVAEKLREAYEASLLGKNWYSVHIDHEGHVWMDEAVGYRPTEYAPQDVEFTTVDTFRICAYNGDTKHEPVVTEEWVESEMDEYNASEVIEEVLEDIESHIGPNE
jgi:hypothetical protein